MAGKNIFKRNSDTHKGDYGHVLVLAGASGFTGAAYLTSQSALLSGSGLVTLGVPQGLYSIMARKLTEVMVVPLAETKTQSIGKKAFPEIKKLSEKSDVLAIGPGMSQNKETQELVRKVITSIDKPMVIDADGLNALIGHLDILPAASDWPILTPHSGEMARLTGKTTAFVQENRKSIAKDFAKKYNVALVLKGRHTVVADPAGRIYINKTGNPGMASGGMGDVLTGIIASFLGQGLGAFEAARLGAEIHGLAGDAATKEKGQLSLTATDLLNKLPEILRKQEVSFKEG